MPWIERVASINHLKTAEKTTPCGNKFDYFNNIIKLSTSSNTGTNALSPPHSQNESGEIEKFLTTCTNFDGGRLGKAGAVLNYFNPLAWIAVLIRCVSRRHTNGGTLMGLHDRDKTIENDVLRTCHYLGRLKLEELRKDVKRLEFAPGDFRPERALHSDIYVEGSGKPLIGKVVFETTETSIYLTTCGKVIYVPRGFVFNKFKKGMVLLDLETLEENTTKFNAFVDVHHKLEKLIFIKKTGGIGVGVKPALKQGGTLRAIKEVTTEDTTGVPVVPPRATEEEVPQVTAVSPGATEEEVPQVTAVSPRATNEEITKEVKEDFTTYVDFLRGQKELPLFEGKEVAPTTICFSEKDMKCNAKLLYSGKQLLFYQIENGLTIVATKDPKNFFGCQFDLKWLSEAQSTFRINFDCSEEELLGTPKSSDKKNLISKVFFKLKAVSDGGLTYYMKDNDPSGPTMDPVIGGGAGMEDASLRRGAVVELAPTTPGRREGVAGESSPDPRTPNLLRSATPSGRSSSAKTADLLAGSASPNGAGERRGSSSLLVRSSSADTADLLAGSATPNGAGERRGSSSLLVRSSSADTVDLLARSASPSASGQSSSAGTDAMFEGSASPNGAGERRGSSSLPVRSSSADTVDLLARSATPSGRSSSADTADLLERSSSEISQTIQYLDQKLSELQELNEKVRLFEEECFKLITAESFDRNNPRTAKELNALNLKCSPEVSDSLMDQVIAFTAGNAESQKNERAGKKEDPEVNLLGAKMCFLKILTSSNEEEISEIKIKSGMYDFYKLECPEASLAAYKRFV